MGNKLSSLFNMGRVCLFVTFVLSALVWQTYQFPSLGNNEFGVETLNKIDAQLNRESTFSSYRAKRSPRRKGRKLRLQKNKDDSSSESESSSEEDSPDNDYSVEDAIDNDIEDSPETDNDYSLEDGNNNDYSVEDNIDYDNDNDYSAEADIDIDDNDYPAEVERLRRVPRRGRQRSKRSEESSEE